MTRSDAVVFVLLLCSAGAVWLTIFKALPAVARARYMMVMVELRDDVEDAVLDGNLRKDEPAVQAFLRVMDLLIKTSRSFTIGDALCVHLTVTEHEVETGPEIDFSGLRPDEVSQMDEYGRRMVLAVRRYLLTGSLTGWVMGAGWIIATATSRLRGVTDKAPTAVELVFDYDHLVEAASKDSKLALAAA